jgi:hypothetical protein
MARRLDKAALILSVAGYRFILDRRGRERYLLDSPGASL